MDGEYVRNELLTSQWSGMAPGSIFYTGGNVGIGTSSPECALSFGNAFNNTNKVIALSSGPASPPETATDFCGFGVTGGNILRYQSLSALAGGHQWFTGATEVMRIGIGAGIPRVCIGSSSLQSKFSVAGNVGIGATFVNTAAPTNGLIVEGNVGIGTASPVTKLDVWTGTARSGTAPPSYGSIYATSDGGGQTTYPPIAEFRHSNQTQGIGINFNSIFATGSTANQPVYLYSRGAAEVRIQGTGVGGSGYGNLLVDYPNAGSAGGCITIRNSASGVGAFSSLIFEVDGTTATTTTSVEPASFTQGNGMLYCQNVGPSAAAKMGFIQWNGSAEVETMTISPNGVITTPNRYYIMGYLAGGTTAGNYINLGSQKSGGGMTITTSNKLVAPVSGLYQFGFQTIMALSSIRNDVNINVNGASIVNTLSEDTTTGYHYRSASICYYLNANDFVQYYCASGTVYGAAAADPWHTFYFFHVG